MKTKWGSSRPDSGSIRLNTDLAKKPPQCLEYIVVHEMAHLLEPTHNDRFTKLMDQFVPQLTIKLIPDGSHWVIHEKRDEVNREIREFIR